jgi:hypothetical protein
MNHPSLGFFRTLQKGIFSMDSLTHLGMMTMIQVKALADHNSNLPDHVALSSADAEYSKRMYCNHGS